MYNHQWLSWGREIDIAEVLQLLNAVHTVLTRSSGVF